MRCQGIFVVACVFFVTVNAFTPITHRSIVMMSQSPAMTIMDSLKSMLNRQVLNPQMKRPGDTELVRVDSEIAVAKEVLNAAVRKEAEPIRVVDQLSALEKLMRKRNKLDGGRTSAETLAALKGSWRLVFTTGTVDTQKKIGKINYFPLKAIQSFDTDTMTLSNGIFLGNIALLKFFGEWSWQEKSRKLEFTFDQLKLFNTFTVKLNKGEAEKLGSASGLGSSSNEELVRNEKKPFFNWISADENIATARGGGGGLALWKKEEVFEL